MGVGQIFGRAGREDGDSKAAGYRLADGLQIGLHAGYNAGKKPGYFVFPDSGQFPFLVPEPVSRIIKGSLENQRNQGCRNPFFADIVGNAG